MVAFIDAVGAVCDWRPPICAWAIASRIAGITSTTEANAMKGQEEQRRRRRILIIEDNVDIADALRELLELNDYCVAIANEGGMGIELAGSFGPELVICDIGLPDVDGYHVARALRQDSRFAHVFLIALSGYARPDDFQRAIEAGFDSHLTKPPDMVRLNQLLTSGYRRQYRPMTDGS